MAYLNDNVIAFSPSITLEQGVANLIKGQYDASKGDTVLKPKEGYAYSEVKIKGVYYSPEGSPYVSGLRIFNAGGKYEGCPNLDSITFEPSANGYPYEMNSFQNCEGLTFLEFANDSNFLWQAPYRFFNCPIEMVIFGAISEDAVIDIWSNGMAEDFAAVTYLQICEGWRHDLAVYESDLPADQIVYIMNNLAQLTEDEYLTLWLGEKNIEKVDPSIIDIGINKGWDIF